MSVLILLVMILLLSTVGFGVALALRGRSRYASQADLVPGLSTNAPASWAGAHTPEATMHRRLGEAMGALRDLAGDPGEDVRLLELRVELEQEAIEVDHRLIAIAAMPPFVRTPALEALERTVVTVEQAAAELVGQVRGGRDASDDRRLHELGTTIRHLGQARAEIEALDGTAALDGTVAPPVEDEGQGTTQTG